MQTPSLRELFYTFFRIGISSFGGLAMTAHIRKHIVDKKQWLPGETFDSGLALCQVIPGAIVMQLSAYIGLKLRGIKGAVVCFVGFGLPAFLVMFILSVLYKHAKNITAVETALQGLRVVIVAIVANAAYLFGSKNFRNLNDVLMAIIAAILFYIKLYPALVLVIASFLGIVMTRHLPEKLHETNVTNTFRFFIRILIAVAACAGILFLISPSYFVLATAMLRVDLFSFGGGLAAMPIMYHEFIDIFNWFDKQTFMDGMILGQVTPGSIIIAATFFGYMKFGVLGSLLATVCVFTPSFLILMGIVPFFDKLRQYPQFNKVINGILCSFVGLLAVITYRFGADIHWTAINIIFALAAFILLIKKVDILWIILAGIILAFL